MSPASHRQFPQRPTVCLPSIRQHLYDERVALELLVQLSVLNGLVLRLVQVPQVRQAADDFAEGDDTLGVGGMAALQEMFQAAHHQPLHLGHFLRLLKSAAIWR